MAFALGAAVLFGASIPFAKILLGKTEPVLLAVLLYLGSGVGLLTLRFLSRQLRSRQEASLKLNVLPWLAGAILSGGIIGPVLLLIGLSYTPASSASLLLNLEGVLTAVLAWSVFKENFDRRGIGVTVYVTRGVRLLS